MIEGTLRTIADQAVVYRVHMDVQGTWMSIWVGACPLDQLHTIPDARLNTCVVEWVVKQRNPIRIDVVSSHDDHEVADQIATQMRHNEMPYAWTMGTMLPERVSGKRVRCKETGEIFANASRCAEHYRISPVALSNHLNGKRYYRTVGGQTFERIAD